MNMRILLVIIIAIVAIGVILSLQANLPTGGPSISTSGKQAPQDTTLAITQELNQIELKELNDEFKAIDADLNTL